MRYRILWLVIFIQVTGMVAAQPAMRVQYAQEVFNKLVRTINLSTPAKPQLNVVPGNDIIAATDKNGQVLIGYGLIEHCRSFGKDSCNALAHILSHELTHYYSNHFWADNFGSAYADLNWGQLIANSGKTYSVIKLYETQADEYGMYYAFAAGYKTLQVGERVLDSVYTWYHLSEQLPGYPSLNERKSIADAAKQNIAQLIPAFETGNLLLTLAQVQSGLQQSMLAQLAGFYYDEILAHKIQTKEIYNNAGLSRLVGLMPYFADSINQIRFPFMLETKSMLYNTEGRRGTQNENDSIITEMVYNGLAEAEELFNSAKRADKGFFPAYINLAIVYFLEGKYGSAEDELTAASKLNAGFQWTISEMNAIIAVFRGNPAAAAIFDKAQERGSTSAIYNKHLLIPDTRLGNEMISFNTRYSTDTTETIGQGSVFETMDKLVPNKSNRYDLISERSTLYTDTTANYNIYYIRPLQKPSLNKVRFMVLRDDAEGATSKNLHRGASIGELQHIYGKPDLIILESDAAIWSYPDKNLLVWVAGEKVQKWGYWWVK